MLTMRADQADGLRQLMASSPGRRLAVVGSAPKVGASSVVQNLAAALQQQGRQVRMHDEHAADASTPETDPGALLLIDAVRDPQGALSPLAAQADQILVVLRPDAESIKHAYACVKQLHYAHALQRIRVLISQVTDASQAQRILANLALTGSRYLALMLEPAGCVRADPRLLQARRLNLTVVEAYRTSPAAVDFLQLAADLQNWHWRMGSTECASVAAQTLH